MNYKNYGGRGITLCDRWADSFLNFLEDMGPKPSPKHKIERRENDKGYSPENCIWATATEQARNQRSNVVVEYKGERMILTDLALKVGVKYFSLRNRMKVQGESAEIAADCLVWYKTRPRTCSVPGCESLIYAREVCGRHYQAMFVRKKPKARRSDNTSGIRGVGLHKMTGKWYARYDRNKVRHDLGLFPTPQEAGEALQQARLKHTMIVTSSPGVTHDNTCT
jgi:hypothetical protein